MLESHGYELYTTLFFKLFSAIAHPLITHDDDFLPLYGLRRIGSIDFELDCTWETLPWYCYPLCATKFMDCGMTTVPQFYALRLSGLMFSPPMIDLLSMTRCFHEGQF